MLHSAGSVVETSANRNSVRIAAVGSHTAKVRNPQMLLKKSLLQRGKSFDSLDYEGIGGFRHDGHPNGTGTVVL